MPANELGSRAQELVDFIAALEMGSFYAKKIEQYFKTPAMSFSFNVFAMRRAEKAEWAERYQQSIGTYIQQLQNVRMDIWDLVIELLRFQKW